MQREFFASPFQEKRNQLTFRGKEDNVSIPYPDYGKYVLTRKKFCPKSVFLCLKGCRKQLGLYAPDDLVVVTRTRYPRTGLGRISNYYFHLNEDCLKTDNPDFTLDMIEISKELKPHLNGEHIKYLKKLHIRLL